jgi:hypothetical protein
VSQHLVQCAAVGREARFLPVTRPHALSHLQAQLSTSRHSHNAALNGSSCRCCCCFCLRQVGDVRMQLAWRARLVRWHGWQAMALAVSRSSWRRNQGSARCSCVQNCSAATLQAVCFLGTSSDSTPDSTVSRSRPRWPCAHQQWQQQGARGHTHSAGRMRTFRACSGCVLQL